MNYQVADFVLRIKNAYLARRQVVVAPYSNITFEIGKLLLKKGFLAEVKEETVDNKRILKITLRYVRRRPALTRVQIVSKPSLRVYVSAHEAVEKHKDAVLSVVSTSRGIMTGSDAAKKGVGGELLFSIW